MFLFLAVCALFFLTRIGSLVVVAGIGVLALWGNHDLATSPSSTSRELGTALLPVLLLVVAVTGIVVDLVVNALWRSARWPRPLD